MRDSRAPARVGHILPHTERQGFKVCVNQEELGVEPLVLQFTGDGFTRRTPVAQLSLIHVSDPMERDQTETAKFCFRHSLFL